MTVYQYLAFGAGKEVLSHHLVLICSIMQVDMLVLVDGSLRYVLQINCLQMVVHLIYVR